MVRRSSPPSGLTHSAVSLAHSPVHRHLSRLVSLADPALPMKMLMHGRNSSRECSPPTMSMPNSATGFPLTPCSDFRRRRSTKSAPPAARSFSSDPMSKRNSQCCSSDFVTQRSKTASLSSKSLLVRPASHRLPGHRFTLVRVKPPMSSTRSWVRLRSIVRLRVWPPLIWKLRESRWLQRTDPSPWSSVVRRLPNLRASPSLLLLQYSPPDPTPHSFRHCVDRTCTVPSTWVLLLDSCPDESRSTTVASGTPRFGRQLQAQLVLIQKESCARRPTAVSMCSCSSAPTPSPTSPMLIWPSVASPAREQFWPSTPH